jgi:hypothetical protein
MAAPVGHRVVGHHPLDPVDADGGEEGRGRAEEAGAGGSGLVGMDLGVGKPGVVIDRGVHVDIARSAARLDLGATVVVLGRAAAMHPPPSRMRPSFFTTTCISSPGRARS